MKLVLILVSLVTLILPAPSSTLTAAERKFAIRYLNETQRDLEKALKGLSDAQLQFHCRELGWCISECLEHLAVVEEGVLGMIRHHAGRPVEPGQGSALNYSNKQLIDAVIQRPEKLSRPDASTANSKYENWRVCLSAFSASREEMKSWIEKTQDDLHAHLLPHPALGMLDTYQWILSHAAHTHRHLLQIEEAKDDPRFPRK